MAKIIECFSTKLLTRITLYVNRIVDEVDENGVVVIKTATDMQHHINISLHKYDSINDIRKEMSDMKSKYIIKDGYLFLVTDERNLFGSRFLPKTETKNNDVLSKIKVEDNFVYEQKEADYNEEIFDKIDVVYQRVKSYAEDDEEIKPVENVVNGIRRSYKNTGIISKDDLKWLNKIYNKFNKER